MPKTLWIDVRTALVQPALTEKLQCQKKLSSPGSGVGSLAYRLQYAIVLPLLYGE